MKEFNERRKVPPKDGKPHLARADSTEGEGEYRYRHAIFSGPKRKMIIQEGLPGSPEKQLKVQEGVKYTNRALEYTSRLDVQLFSHSNESAKLVVTSIDFGKEVTEKFGTPDKPKWTSGRHERRVFMSYHNGGEDGHTSIGPHGAGVPRNVILLAHAVNEAAGEEIFDPIDRATGFYAANAHDLRQLCGRTLLSEGQGKGRGDELLSAQIAAENYPSWRYLEAGGDPQVARHIYEGVMATAYNPETKTQNVDYKAWLENPNDPEIVQSLLNQELVAGGDWLGPTTPRGPLGAIEYAVEILFLKQRDQIGQKRLRTRGIEPASIQNMEQMMQIIGDDEVLSEIFTELVAEQGVFFKRHLRYSDKAIRSVCGKGIDELFPGRMPNGAILDTAAVALKRKEEKPITVWKGARSLVRR